LSDLDVNDGGADALGGRDHRCGVSVEQDGVAFAARRGSRPRGTVVEPRRTVVEYRNRAHGPADVGRPTEKSRISAFLAGLHPDQVQESPRLWL